MTASIGPLDAAIDELLQIRVAAAVYLGDTLDECYRIARAILDAAETLKRPTAA